MDHFDWSRVDPLIQVAIGRHLWTSELEWQRRFPIGGRLIAAGLRRMRKTESADAIEVFEVSSFQAFGTGLGSWLAMLEPSQPVGEKLVGDSTVAPGVRWDLASTASYAGCLNFRERFVGIDPRRVMLLGRLVEVVEEGSRLQDSLRVWHEQIERAASIVPGIFGFSRRGKWCAEQ